MATTTNVVVTSSSFNNLNMDGSTTSVTLGLSAFCEQQPFLKKEPVGVGYCYLNGVSPTTVTLSGTQLTMSWSTALSAGNYGFQLELLFDPTV